MSGLRVAHLVSHPIQYFAPLYRELAQRDEIDLTVYFYSDATVREFMDPAFGRPVIWDLPLLDGYRSTFLPSASTTDISGRFVKRPNWDIVRDVASGRFDVLWVHGYAHLTTWLAVAAARARGMRVLIRDEQTLLHPRAPHKAILKTVALRALFSQCAALYIGQRNREHFSRYGMPDERLFAAPYCVDASYFHSHAADRVAARARFGINDEAPIVLFAGKLIEKKQPLRLIEAFSRARERVACTLLIVGDGPLRAEVEAAVGRLRVPDVRCAGFLNQSEIGDAYAAADLFVLPSKVHETWGLVVNEAMSFGLPVIVSDKVGCAPDLVEDGGNGVVVRHDDVRALADAIAALVADADARRRFGQRSRQIIGRYTIVAAADGVVDACLARRRRQDVSDRALAA